MQATVTLTGYPRQKKKNIFLLKVSTPAETSEAAPLTLINITTAKSSAFIWCTGKSHLPFIFVILQKVVFLFLSSGL